MLLTIQLSRFIIWYIADANILHCVDDGILVTIIIRAGENVQSCYHYRLHDLNMQLVYLIKVGIFLFRSLGTFTAFYLRHSYFTISICRTPSYFFLAFPSVCRESHAIRIYLCIINLNTLAPYSIHRSLLLNLIEPCWILLVGSIFVWSC